MQVVERIKGQQTVFESGIVVDKSDAGEIKYQIQCDTHNGFMHCYHLFPGIDLAYSTFQASTCIMRSKSMPNILEIAFCQTGRFECEYKHGYVTYWLL